MKTKDRKKALFFISFVCILCMMLAILGKIEVKKEDNIMVEEKTKIETSLLYIENSGNRKKNDTDSKDVEEEILATYKGYPVIAKLEIPKIELETYVISEYSESALKISVTKFYGGNPNQVGNFCIAGHNYITKNMFHDLKNIAVGDNIFLTDSINNKFSYIVYSIETVEPNETQCLSQKTEGRTELTLITCTTDSSKRIIIKAVKN